ncbi:hypothetical protein AAFF_G00048560 [Aldrovandia affinis]|uniref:F-box domain-containing protein n=1 Tax=Aldrovandia affinis TaxID=143900 RepID=A0AAD7WEX1_9TELE|nr:hypothetical protein AAFF_G00048560 [Aldrovandia affinis]
MIASKKCQKSTPTHPSCVTSLSAFHLPQEVWTQIFLFLSDEEKGNIRASCKYFKRLIDHPSLWRRSAVVLKRVHSYSAQFWTTLRRRKTSAAVVHKAATRDWELIAARLPWLTAITVEQCPDARALAALRRFGGLRRLVIRSFHCPAGLAGALAPLRALTHLCLCELQRAPRAELIGAVSQLAGLTSLSYHEGDKPISKRTLQGMLARLPHLKQLSLKLGPVYGTLPEDYFSLPATNRDVTSEATVLGRGDPPPSGLGLTRLELLNYMDPMLSPGALVSLSSLQSLTVSYRERAVRPSSCALRTWLCKLPCLTELTVTRGYPLAVYVRLLPASLRRLCLLQLIVGDGDLRDLGKRTPGLQHLHVDPSQGDGADCRSCPPSSQLETSNCARCGSALHLNVTEWEFVGLARFQNLQQLVVLDALPGPSPALLSLIHKLQIQTNYRVQVVHSLALKDPAACFCSQY